MHPSSASLINETAEYVKACSCAFLTGALVGCDAGHWVWISL